MAAEELHQETSWQAAWHLGLRETSESMRQVYFILFRLLGGQLSPTNLGGPASIATMAGMEAHRARQLLDARRLSARAFAGVLRTRAALEITDARRLPPRVSSRWFSGIREVLGHEAADILRRQVASLCKNRAEQDWPGDPFDGLTSVLSPL